YRDDDGPRALAAFRERRAASLTFLAELAPARLGGAAERPGGGALSGLDLLAAWVAHDRLHLAQLAATLARRCAWTTRARSPTRRRPVADPLGVPVVDGELDEVVVGIAHVDAGRDSPRTRPRARSRLDRDALPGEQVEDL